MKEFKNGCRHILLIIVAWAEFAAVCEQSTDFHFPDLAQQLSAVETALTQASAVRASRQQQQQQETDSSSVHSSGSNSSGSSENQVCSTALKILSSHSIGSSRLKVFKLRFFFIFTAIIFISLAHIYLKLPWKFHGCHRSSRNFVMYMQSVNNNVFSVK